MKIIFVGGYLRTGTTMLQTILCASPDCHPMVGESVFLRGTVEGYWRTARMFDEHARYFFTDRDHMRATFARHLTELLEIAADRLGHPRVLVMKHPQLTERFPQIHELLPEARFVVILRNPLDTVASALTAKRKGAKEFGKSEAGDLATTIARYYGECMTCPSPLFQERTLYVRYEALVADPAPLVAHIGAFTGIDLSGFTPDMANLRSLRPFDQAAAAASVFHSENYGKAIVANRVSRYREVLSEGDIRLVRKKAGWLIEMSQLELGTFLVHGTKDGQVDIRAYAPD
ncbi:MAG: sulfotransferase [Magnetospirillum sp. WYHS-4]